MPKPNKISPKLLVFFFLLVVLALVQMAAIAWKLDTAKAPGTAQAPKGFNTSRYPIDEASSTWVVINKNRVLPSGYAPEKLTVPGVPLRTDSSDPHMGLRADAAKALENMFADAAKDNVKLRLGSGYRSYPEQAGIYSSEVRAFGLAEAERQSARPGYSEHQTGLAADIIPNGRSCEFEPCFADTAEGKWLKANAHKHGFIIRYLPGKEKITGYKHESWHFRYVGKELSQEIHRLGVTMEQFFGLPAAPKYAQKPFQLR